MLALSLMRDSRAFSQRAFLALDTMFPFVAAVARRQWTDLDQRFGKPAAPPGPHKPQQRMAYDLGRFGDGILTPREREVAEFTLYGHSAE